MQFRIYSSLLLAALALGACNTSSDGAKGNIAFTPDDCGYPGCSFSESIAVGTTISLQIAGLEGVSTAGATLSSSDTNILTVMPIADNGQPTWQVAGKASGNARLIVETSESKALDFIDVTVETSAGLTATKILGDAVGPTLVQAPNAEKWIINADQAVSFQIAPVSRSGERIMGKQSYAVVLAPEIESALLQGNTATGYLYFTAPAAGEYDVTVTDTAGNQQLFQFQTQ